MANARVSCEASGALWSVETLAADGTPTCICGTVAEIHEGGRGRATTYTVTLTSKVGSPPRGKLTTPQRSNRRLAPRSRSRSTRRHHESDGDLRDRLAQLEAELLAERAARQAIVADHQAAEGRWAQRHSQTVRDHEREMRAAHALAGKRSVMQQTRSQDDAQAMKAAIRELQQLKRKVKQMESERAAERVAVCVHPTADRTDPVHQELDPLPYPEQNSVWLHYKHTQVEPKRYRVVGVAKHTETDAALVMYHSLDGDRQLWARPLRMWQENVVVAQPWPDGPKRRRPRFVLQPDRHKNTPASLVATQSTNSDSGAGVGSCRYVALVQVLLRQDADLSSAKVGTLGQGEEIEALDTIEVDGAVRVHCSRGWASVFTRKGKQLLKPLDHSKRGPATSLGVGAVGSHQQQNSVVVAQLASLANHIDGLLDTGQDRSQQQERAFSVTYTDVASDTHRVENNIPRSIFQRGKAPSSMSNTSSARGFLYDDTPEPEPKSESVSESESESDEDDHVEQQNAEQAQQQRQGQRRPSMVQSLLGGHNDSDAASASMAPLMLASDGDADENDQDDTRRTQQDSQSYSRQGIGAAADSRAEGDELSTDVAAARSTDEWDLILGPSVPSPQLDVDGSAVRSRSASASVSGPEPKSEAEIVPEPKLRSGPDPAPEPEPKSESVSESVSVSESDEDDHVEQQNAEQAQQQWQGQRRPSMVQSLLGGHNDSDAASASMAQSVLARAGDDNEQPQNSNKSANNTTHEEGKNDEDEDPFEMLRKLLPD